MASDGVAPLPAEGLSAVLLDSSYCHETLPGISSKKGEEGLAFLILEFRGNGIDICFALW